MNLLFSHRWMIPSILLVFGLSACCPRCDKGFLGDFGLTNGTSEWMAFHTEASLIFENQDKEKMVLTYLPLESDFRSSSDECEQQGNCGLCCYNYNVGFLFTELSGPDLNSSFQLTIEKNLITNSPTDPVGNLDDMLTINVGTRINETLFGLPDTTLPQSVNINGKSFSRVFFSQREYRKLSCIHPSQHANFFLFHQRGGNCRLRDIWRGSLGSKIAALFTKEPIVFPWEGREKSLSLPRFLINHFIFLSFSQ